jgi:hypothetical protein
LLIRKVAVIFDAELGYLERADYGSYMERAKDHVTSTLDDATKLYHLRYTEEEAAAHQKELADRLRYEFGDKLRIADLLSMKPRPPKQGSGGEAKPAAGGGASA